MLGDPNSQQQNPLAGLMSLLVSAGGSAAPQMPQGAPMPQQAAPQQMPQAMPQQQPQAQGMNPIIQGLMGQAQQTMQSPAGQAVPQPSGLIDPMQHPLIGAIIKGIANAAQSFGWTAMQPQERLERTQLNQQKAESLAKLAETGAYEQGNLDVRRINSDTNREKADTQATNVASLSDYRNFQKQNAQDKLSLAQDANQWKQDMAQGRLDKAQQLIDQKATQFEQKINLATKQFGLNETKVELQGEGLQIKQGMLDLARTALAQRGTVEGAQTTAKLQQFKIEHPILSQFMDLSDLDSLVGGAGGAGIPGVTPAQSPVVPQSSTMSNVGTPTTAAPNQPSPKAKAKGATGGKPQGVWDPVAGVYK